MGKGTGSGDGTGAGTGEGSGRGQGSGSGAYKGKTERVAVPAMPGPMAVICCILNFLIPGLGTVVAGFSNFCCSRNEDIDKSARCVSCLLNGLIGFLQLLTTFLFFLGWIWSCVWGVFFIGMSAEYYHNNSVNATDGNQGMVLQSNQVIVTQPGVYPGPTVVTHPTGAGPTLITQPGYPYPPPYQPVVAAPAGSPVVTYASHPDEVKTS